MITMSFFCIDPTPGRSRGDARGSIPVAVLTGSLHPAPARAIDRRQSFHVKSCIEGAMAQRRPCGRLKKGRSVTRRDRPGVGEKRFAPGRMAGRGARPADCFSQTPTHATLIGVNIGSSLLRSDL